MIGKLTNIKIVLALIVGLALVGAVAFFLANSAFFEGNEDVPPTLEENIGAAPVSENASAEEQLEAASQDLSGFDMLSGDLDVNELDASGGGFDSLETGASGL